MRLINVRGYTDTRALSALYKLLEERTPEQSISHTAMPTWEEHCKFVANHPYRIWYMICNDENYDLIYGSLYLTKDREIGLFVFNKYQNQGVGTLALKELLTIHRGPFYANINPKNGASVKFFEKHGFEHLQCTYKLPLAE